MSIDVVLISTYGRPELFKQTVVSMKANAADWPHCRLAVVFNEKNPDRFLYSMRDEYDTMIACGNVGASAARNIGASSIPKYRRGEYVMFCDDDCYFAPSWDEKLLALASRLTKSIISGHAHPYNGSELMSAHVPYPNYTDMTPQSIDFAEPLVISTVNMLMPWSLWDDVGFFVEPGGAGGSEDYDYCMRAKAKDYGFGVTEPQIVLHTGITSSNGRPIVGQKEVIENNRKLIEIHGLKDVIFE